VAVLSAATSLKTDLAEARYRLSLALRALGRISEAEEELRLARKLDPSLKQLE
jgi:Flp pilus assembly protein TadD